MEYTYPVVKQNDLIMKTKFNLTLQEQKIILYLISKIKPTDDDLHKYIFSISEFCNLLNIDYDNGKNYYNLKRTIKNLTDKSFWIKLDDKVETIVRWIEKPYINKNDGIIKVRLDKDLKPYLLNLKEHFTKYDLYYILNFNSKYSIRLYEFLKSNEWKNNFEISIDELQIKLQSNYTKFNDFKRKVIEISLKEINQQTDIKILVEYKKVGRAYKTIIFNIENKYNNLREKLSLDI